MLAFIGLLMLIGIMMVGPAFGEDFFLNFNIMGGWFHEPYICIIDPPDRREAIAAVGFWQLVFDDLGIEGFDYKIAVRHASDQVTGCDVIIKFVSGEEVMKRAGDSELGITQCYETNTIYYEVFGEKIIIREGERRCFIFVNPDYPSTGHPVPRCPP